MMNIVIRDALNSDLERIMEIEEMCFSDPWTESMFKSLLKVDTGRLYVACDGERICGFISVCVIPGEEGDVCGDCELMNVAVEKDYRGRKIAKKLMSYMYDTAEKNYCSHIFLEVRESNTSAIRLYISEGFEIYSKRKNYYRQPTEDALLMKKRLV